MDHSKFGPLGALWFSVVPVRRQRLSSVLPVATFAMPAPPDRQLDAAHLGDRIARAFSDKLGRCWRCMTASALLAVVSWAVVVRLALVDPPLVAPVAVATVAATASGLLAIAHAVAFAARRRTAARPAGELEAKPAAAVVKKGCGCGKHGRTPTETSAHGSGG